MIMKKTVLILAAAWLVAACSTKEVIPSAPVFTASVENAQSTRTFVGEGLKVCWHAEDNISLFNKSTFPETYVFKGAEGDLSGKFEKGSSSGLGGLGTAVPYVYAAYPAGASINAGGVITTTFPVAQAYAPNSFAKDVNPMVAVSEDDVLYFRNVGGYLHVKLYGAAASLNYLEISGNNDEVLSGKASVTITPGGEPAVTMQEGGNYYTSISFKDPVTLATSPETATDFWFVLPPVEFQKGITIYGETTDNKFFEVSSTKPLNIRRNVRSNTAPLEVQLEDMDYFTVHVAGAYTFNIKSAYEGQYQGYGPYTNTINMISYKSDEGNMVMYGTFTDVDAVMFGTFDETTGKITVPMQVIGEIEDATRDSNGNIVSETDLVKCDLILGLVKGSSILSDDIIFTVTGDHQVEWTAPNTSTYLGLLFQNVKVYAYDLVKITSIVYKPSATVAAAAANTGLNVSLRLPVELPGAVLPAPFR